MRQGDAPLSKVFGEWIVSIWIYDIFLSCAIGAVIGYVARKTLKVAHRRKLVDHESLYVSLLRRRESKILTDSRRQLGLWSWTRFLDAGDRRRIGIG